MKQSLVRSSKQATPGLTTNTNIYNQEFLFFFFSSHHLLHNRTPAAAAWDRAGGRRQTLSDTRLTMLVSQLNACTADAEKKNTNKITKMWSEVFDTLNSEASARPYCITSSPPDAKRKSLRGSLRFFFFLFLKIRDSPQH